MRKFEWGFGIFCLVIAVVGIYHFIYNPKGNWFVFALVDAMLFAFGIIFLSMATQDLVYEQGGIKT